MKKLLLAMTTMGLLHACVKLPADADYLSKGAGYTQSNFQPILGRTTVMPNDPFATIFNADHSTLPLTFKMLSVRDAETGDTVDLFNKTFDVQVWKEAYTGFETTREEIEKKRVIEKHRLFEVREHSGQLVFWTPQDLQYLNAVKVQPHKGYKFDIEVSNSGGSKVIHNLELQPLRPQPFEPTNVDPVTGNSYGVLRPSVVSGIKNYNDDSYLSSADVQMVFYKDLNSKENTLTFEFRDSSYAPIDPKKFNSTQWEKVCHHFGEPVFTPEGVTYQVAYPIPLAAITTQYTTVNGLSAQSMFSFNRIGTGGMRQDATIGTQFRIFEPGAWKIIFWFYRGNPDFRNN
ncbi:DUF5007 domain-containing protein [Chitinophaga sp. CB10]|uniref:DUF5007 domain-containing protein n=1 Tax=Chitinophaga sp. CB10 TaxID=1891659 RepID=UPI0025BA5891|nr:DUF5007 domain-containing protein [Chitinophaga sp. CB10]